MTWLGLPAAKGLFSKAVASSGFASGIAQKDARKAGKALVEKAKETYALGSDEEALDKLAAISYDELFELSQDTLYQSGHAIWLAYHNLIQCTQA